jgi:hypothetical protein
MSAFPFSVEPFDLDESSSAGSINRFDFFGFHVFTYEGNREIYASCLNFKFGWLMSLNSMSQLSLLADPGDVFRCMLNKSNACLLQ